ncbi:MAG: hypothetical protein OSJ61_24225 [Lachnospiraceae bacterium]|nr:hypothetical protein [Lachnospiraceae bacterium]
MKKRIFSATAIALMIAGTLASSTVLAATGTDVPPQENPEELTASVRIIREGEVIDEIEITNENPVIFEVQSEEDDGLGTIVGTEDGIMPLSSHSYEWKVTAGSSSTGANKYYLRVDDVVEVSGSWAETNAGTVKIGVTNGTTFYYVEGSKGSASGSFKITTAGNYQFKVKNEGSQDINIKGYFSL